MATITTLQSISGEMFDASSMFTCLSCSIAFSSADDQRAHYRSDHHRYNMKRRVASLPPVSVGMFNQKVLERRTDTAVTSSNKGSSCDICSKTYATENAYRSHINSKRHKDAEVKYSLKSKSEPSEPAPPAPQDDRPDEMPTTEQPDIDNDDVEMTIDQKIAQARNRLTIADCLFCSNRSDSLSTNLSHMSVAHSFFIPDSDYLVDLEGLITYLGEKITVGNVCIYCYGRRRKHTNAKGHSKRDEEEDEAITGREFKTLEATRRHMVDKAHCKIAYETEEERLELSDYYDFTSSYPNDSKKKSHRSGRDDEWEEVSNESGEEVDEVVEESEDSEGDDTPGITLGDSPFELVLPSGARIGHRSLRHYYKQNYRSSIRQEPPTEEDPKSGVALVRHLLSQKNSALVPCKGGFGAYGDGGQVVKARNPGEAREAGRHVKEFRDVKKRQDFQTKVAFIANNQKHYRDPLLQ